MPAVQLTTRNCLLNAIFIACAVLISGVFNTCHASDLGSIYVNFDGVTNAQVVTLNTPGGPEGGVLAGQYTCNRLSGTTTAVNALFPGKFYTFCIDNQNIYTNEQLNYKVVDNIIGLPDPIGSPNNGVGIGVTQANELQWLVNNHFASLTASQMAEFQAVVWKIVGTGTVTSGIDTTLTGNFLTWYNQAITHGSDGGYANGTGAYTILGLTNNDAQAGQDQLAIVSSSDYTGHVQPAPVPAGTVLASMGVFCLGGYNFLRRRKAAVVA